MALGTAHNTITTAANYIPEIWSNDVIAGYKSNTVMSNLVKKINHSGNKGDTIHVPNFTRSDASVKAAQTEVTLVAPTHGTTPVVIDQHYEYSTIIEDIVKVQALNTMRRAYTDDAGYSLARRIDSDIHAQFESLNGGAASGTGTWTGAVIAGDGTTAYDQTASANAGNGTDITDAGIRAMILQLDNADVPMQDRCIVIPPIAKSDLMGLARFTEQAFIGSNVSNSPIKTGLLGEIYGMPVYVSTNCPVEVAADTTTNYRVGHMFHKDSVVFAEQMAIRSQSQYKQEWLGDLFTADCLYGVAEYRDDAGVSFVLPST